MLQPPYQVAHTQLSIKYTLSIMQGLLHHHNSPYKKRPKARTPLYKYQILSYPFYLSFAPNSRNYLNIRVICFAGSPLVLLTNGTPNPACEIMEPTLATSTLISTNSKCW